MSKNKIMSPVFFNRRTPVVANGLLGKFLVRRWQGRKIAGMITETEAYDGWADRGSHAARGHTPRNAPMFGPAGCWYIYFTYGMHWMLNIVTCERGYPAAVLIRSTREVAGPGRLTKYFHITGGLNGRPAGPVGGLWIEDRGIVILQKTIRRGGRIGISYAGPYWARRHWRFWL